ncbi:TPA: MarR family transcriptional regulator [Candidatus Geothermarchaeota archaeon]|nr:MarR family transcriptional regulator [Candidatus Geothermarchaeota archaeon]
MMFTFNIKINIPSQILFMMISLFEMSVMIFVISITITLIIMIRELSLLKKKFSSTSYSEIVLISNKLEDLSREIGLLKRQLKSSKSVIEGKTLESTMKDKEVKKEFKYTQVTEQPSKIRTPSEQLSSIEIEVIKILLDRGEVSSSDLRDVLGKSREHISRVLKTLYEKGYLERIENIKPYRYRLNKKAVQKLNL